MIPCKMPDETLSTLSETLSLLRKASELARQLVAENKDVECHDQYLKLALELERLLEKAAIIKTDRK